MARRPSFSQHLKDTAQAAWDAQFTHPFVLALGDGTLLQRLFKFYILQDSLFLVGLARVFAAAAMKAPDLETIERFNELVTGTIVTERGLHKSYGQAWKMTEAEMRRVPMAPTTFAYTRHLLHVAETGNVAEITVASLPCAWIYCDVGRHLLRKGQPPKTHPYRDWLLLYASPEFAEVARWMREKVDHWAAEAGPSAKRRLEELFLIGCRYEYLFWEMAWQEERWPV